MNKVAQMMQAAAGAAGAEALAIEDVFSTYLYTGNGSTQTITNGIDLAGEGGLVWLKCRDAAYNNIIVDSERGSSNGTAYNLLFTNLTNAQNTAPSYGVTSFNTNGFTLGPSGQQPISNQGGASYPDLSYASWTFRKAPRFFDVVTYTGSGTGLGQVINHNLGVTPGFVVIKRTDSASNWLTAHRSLNGQGVALNLSDGQDGSYYAVYGNNDSITDTTVKVSVGADFSGATYVMYLFAHDPLGESGDGSDGLIACGSYTGNGSTDGPEINLGWEPQWVLIKRTDVSGPWNLHDNMRNLSVTGRAYLRPNEPESETSSSTATGLDPLPDGFRIRLSGSNWNASGGNYIYIAIRRGPMRQPTSGTEVFAISTRDSTPPQHQAGFPVDMILEKPTIATGDGTFNGARLIGERYLLTNTTAAEVSNPISAVFDYDYMDGWRSGTSASSFFYSWMFRRAPGFFDVVAYSGNSTTTWYNHNLQAVPELIIVKSRNSAEDWSVYSKDRTGTNKILVLNSNSAEQTVLSPFDFPSTPTDTQFRLGTNSRVNSSGNNYIAYLFATLPGVSKVGSYTGNGSSQTINCGFTSGARFILIKRTNSSGNWYVWDTARGIVAANDPHLSLNTTAAEVTTDDSIDPASTGFIVNQVAATNINVSSASYIFMAIS